MRDRENCPSFRLILIRHAEAEGQGRYLGRRSDPPLSETGRRQAEQLLGSLSAEISGNPYEHTLFFTSPQKRARETAEILLSGSSGIIRGINGTEMVPEFAEIDFGEWDGMSWSEISDACGDRYRAWLNNPAETAPPGGESLTDFSDRTGRGLKTVCAGLDGIKNDTALIVTHGGAVRMMLCLLLGLPVDRYSAFHINCASYSCVRVFGNRYPDVTAVLEYLNR